MSIRVFTRILQMLPSYYRSSVQHNVMGQGTKMRQFAIIGLGRFGISASRELMKTGHSVLGIDINPQVIEKYADDLTHAVIADVTDQHALEELGLDNYDVVLVAIGSDFQANLLCVVHLKSLGINQIWVQATNNAEHLILNKIGVTRIIHPAEEMGVRVAQALSYPMVNDYISLGNGEFIVEISVSEHLNDIALKHILDKGGSLHVLLIKRKTEVFVHPDADFRLQPKDILIVSGQLTVLRSLAPKLI